LFLQTMKGKKPWYGVKKKLNRKRGGWSSRKVEKRLQQRGRGKKGTGDESLVADRYP